MSVTPVLDVTCLCAQWCGTCRDYREVFAQCAQALPGHRFRWVDIEDEADLVGDIDIETFPTLLVGRAGQALFGGPVLPRLSDLQRLLDRLQRPDAVPDPGLSADLCALAAQLAREVRSAR